MVDYHEIFEKFPDGVTLHDAADGAILETNQGFCDMLGYTRDELLDLEFDDLHVNEPPYTTEQAEQYIHQAATEGPQTFEWLDETKAGDPLPVEVHLSQTQIGGEERILAVVRDISERKESERELERETGGFEPSSKTHPKPSPGSNIEEKPRSFGRPTRRSPTASLARRRTSSASPLIGSSPKKIVETRLRR